MLSFRSTCVYVAGILAMVLALRPAQTLGQPPSSGTYTYRYGYNPGYYGSSTAPRDPWAKPGQTTASWGGSYWYVVPAAVPARSVPGPAQFSIRITR